MLNWLHLVLSCGLVGCCYPYKYYTTMTSGDYLKLWQFTLFPQTSCKLFYPLDVLLLARSTAFLI